MFMTFMTFMRSKQSAFSPERYRVQPGAWRLEFCKFGNSSAREPKYFRAMFTTFTQPFAFRDLSGEYRPFYMFTDVHQVHRKQVASHWSLVKNLNWNRQHKSIFGCQRSNPSAALGGWTGGFVESRL
jgi:hypothetical protein